MTALRFLVLEDNPLDVELMHITLTDGGVDCDLLRVDTRTEFVRALETDTFDLILADYTLPDFDGISALEIARSLCPDTPFVIVSASLGEERAIETLKRGATDYILKQRIKRLVPAVNRALREAQERLKRKRAEAALRQSEAQYRTLFESIDEGFCICEMLFDANNQPVEYRFLKVNPSFESLTGLQQATGKTARELVPNLEAYWVEAYGRVVQTGESRRFERQSISMNRRWFDVNAFPMGEPQSNQFAILFTNISERKQTQQQLQQTLHTLQTLIAASPLPIVIIEPDCIVQLWNPAAERLFGWSEAEVLGKPIPIVPPEKQEECRLLREAVINGEIFSGVETYRCKQDGSTAIVSVSAALLDNSNAIVLLFQDITEQQQAEVALRSHEAQLQTLFDEAPLGIYLIDADFRLRQVNPAALPAFGEIPNLVGRDFDEITRIIWPQTSADEIVARFRHTLETGEPYHVPEMIEQRHDRGVTEYYEWQVSRILLSEGRYGVVSYFRDISAQVLARQAIAASEERLISSRVK
jgi:PAS domain S-box-containing protein